MAINAYGVVGTVDDSHWSRLMQQLGDGRAGMSIQSGLAASVSTGRVVNISSGQCLQAGVYVIAASGTTYSVTIAANTTSNPRIDQICMQVDWAAATAAYNNTSGTVDVKAAAASAAGASLVVVQGVAAPTPVVPTLTKNVGTLWQTELCKVTVRAGVTTLLATDLSDVRPYAVEKTCSGSIVLSDGGTDPKTLDVTFPLRYFSQTPRVVLTPVTGASNTTISNLNVSNQASTGFTATINRSTTTSVTLNWLASGY